MRKKLSSLLFMLLLIGVVLPSAGQEPQDEDGVMVALSIDGEVEFARMGWSTYQPLAPGTLLNLDDMLDFGDGAVLIVMCPDGTIRDFLASELLPNDVLDCPATPVIVGDRGQQQLAIQRGGRQSPTIPYLIAPRNTVVREPSVVLQWNALSEVQHYQIFVQFEQEEWDSGLLNPLDVALGDIAQIEFPVLLQPDLAYSVDICVRFTDLREGCTSTNPDWSVDNVAFYYHDDPALSTAENQVIDRLGEDTPESRYARAVLLSQPVLIGTGGSPLGYNQAAINLLEVIVFDDPDSDLAHSAELHLLRGHLYQRIGLIVSANQAYANALDTASPGTEAAALAHIGLALTTPSSDELDLYPVALDIFAAYLTDDAYLEQLVEVCGLMGGLCLELPECSEQFDDCVVWSQGASE